MSRLEGRLTDILGVKVDLAPAKALRELVYRAASAESVLAF